MRPTCSTSPTSTGSNSNPAHAATSRRLRSSVARLPTRAKIRSFTVPGTSISAMTFVVAHVPSGFFVRNCPSRRPRRISKTKNGLPSDFVAIFPASSSARCSECEAVAEQEHEVLRAETRQSDARHVLAAVDLRDPRGVDLRTRRPDEQDAVPRDGERQRGEERASLLRREVQVVDQDDRRTLRRERPRRVDEDRLQRDLRQRLRARRRDVAAQQRRERRREQRRLRQRGADGRLVVAEVLAVGRRERAATPWPRRRAGSCRRGSSRPRPPARAARRTRRRAGSCRSPPRPRRGRRARRPPSSRRRARAASRAPRPARRAPSRAGCGSAAADAACRRGSPSPAPATTRSPRPASSTSSSAAADAKRASRSFSSRRRSTSSKNGESCGFTSPAGRGVSVICCRTTTRKSSPSNGCRPVASS